LVALAELLKLPERDDKEQARAVSAVQRWLQHHSDWLLIVDNADNLGLAKEFIPITGSGRVLLTTRVQATRELVPPLPVEKLDTEFGGLFLLRRGGVIADTASMEAAPEAEPEAAHTLAEELDGLPFALDQAGAYMEEGDLTAAEYLDLYREQGKALRAERGGLNPDHPSVTVTFAIAFNKTLAVSPAAAELLRLCAFLDPTGIPEELFTEGHRELGEMLSEALSAPLGFVEVRRETCRLSLMARDRPNQLLMMHPVVQETLKDEMDEAIQRKWAERMVRLVSDSFPNVEFPTWPQCERLLPQALRSAAAIAHWELAFPEAAYLLNQTAVFLYERARYEEAEPHYARALAIREKALGPEHPDVAQNLNNLAELYRAQGRYEAAEPLYQQALAIAEKALGPEHQAVGTRLNNLAELYYTQGRYEEAKLLYARALAIVEKALGPEHPLTTTIRKKYEACRSR
jgi:tetratricopeptide (TPR) repeat protein